MHTRIKPKTLLFHSSYFLFLPASNFPDDCFFEKNTILGNKKKKFALLFQLKARL